MLASGDDGRALGRATTSRLFQSKRVKSQASFPVPVMESLSVTKVASEGPEEHPPSLQCSTSSPTAAACQVVAVPPEAAAAEGEIGLLCTVAWKAQRLCGGVAIATNQLLTAIGVERGGPVSFASSGAAPKRRANRHASRRRA